LVRFGNTDLFVSRLCQGTAFRKVTREADDPNAQIILHRAMDIGVNFFDSSNAYGWGGAEMALGKAIKGRRDKVVICTKVSPNLKPKPGEKSQTVALTRDFIFREAEGSLKRLGTDYIDLYLFHSPDRITPAEQLADSMDALVRSGKVRYWGASNFDMPMVAEFGQLSKRNGKAPIAGLEDYYNVIAAERGDFMEQQLFPLIRQYHLGLMAFSPIAEGRLAPDRPADPNAPWAGVVKALDDVAKELGATRPQVSVAWVISHPEVTSVLAGAEKPEHVEDNFKGTQLVLPSGARRILNAAAAAMPRVAHK
jgi:aryl-alcohol dehydrogenase-like predicted oxidoreductase